MIPPDELEALARSAGILGLPAHRGFSVADWRGERPQWVYAATLREQIRGVELRHYPYSVEWSVEVNEPNFSLQLSIDVKDRVVGGLRRVTKVAPISSQSPISGRAIVEAMRRLLHEFVTREVDESVYLDGFPIFNLPTGGEDPMIDLISRYTPPRPYLYIASAMDGVWRALEIRGLPYGIWMSCVETSLDSVAKHLRAKTMDTHTGREMLTGLSESERINEFRVGATLRRAREMLVRFVTHEVDECFRISGQQPFDPHADDKPLPSRQRGGNPPRR